MHKIMEFFVTFFWALDNWEQKYCKLLAISQTIHTVCCEGDYFPKAKFKLFNSLLHSVYLVFPKSLFSTATLFAVRCLWVICNEDKCCVVTQCAADIPVAWLVYFACLRLHVLLAYATLNQNKRTRLLYLGDAPPKKFTHASYIDAQIYAPTVSCCESTI